MSFDDSMPFMPFMRAYDIIFYVAVSFFLQIRPFSLSEGGFES